MNLITVFPLKLQSINWTCSIKCRQNACNFPVIISSLKCRIFLLCVITVWQTCLENSFCTDDASNKTKCRHTESACAGWCIANKSNQTQFRKSVQCTCMSTYFHLNLNVYIHLLVGIWETFFVVCRCCSDVVDSLSSAIFGLQVCRVMDTC